MTEESGDFKPVEQTPALRELISMQRKLELLKLEHRVLKEQVNNLTPEERARFKPTDERLVELRIMQAEDCLRKMKALITTDPTTDLKKILNLRNDAIAFIEGARDKIRKDSVSVGTIHPNSLSGI